MKISVLNSNINFGKTLAASCFVKSSKGDNVACSIFKLNRNEDKDYFLNLKTNPDWTNGKYVSINNTLFLSPCASSSASLYVLEDEQGSCLGYLRTSSDENEQNMEQILFLETCPQFASRNKNRDIKYVGQSLIAFIVGLAQKKNRNSVYVPFVEHSANKFYRKCEFRKNKEYNHGLVLQTNKFEKFINKYNKNVGNKITYYI